MAVGKLQQDNSTHFKKVKLRRSALRRCPEPIVMETNGGYGALYKSLYHALPTGIVIEKEEDRAEALAQQRPSWAVYCADSTKAIAAGLGNHLPVNFLDVDPYGSPWKIIDGFLNSDRELPPVLHIVVNDGLRQNVQIKRGWANDDLREAVAKFGNELYPHYLEICEWMMERKAQAAGYEMGGWHGYYCGHSKQMTHYWAVLKAK